MPLAEIHRRQEWIFQTFGRDGRIFVRPDDNAKSFGGGVVEVEGFARWWELANFYRPGPDCLAVVSPAADDPCRVAARDRSQEGRDRQPIPPKWSRESVSRASR